MPVSRATSRKVLAVCLIAGGSLLALTCGAVALLVLGTSGLRGMGNPTPESTIAGVREDHINAAIAGGIGVIGVVVVVIGIWSWRRAGSAEETKGQTDGGVHLQR